MKYILPLIFVLLSAGAVNSVQSQPIGSITIFPNPCVDTVNINYHIDEFGRFDLELFNIIGQKFWNPLSDSMHWPGSYQISYNVSHLQNGVYFLTLTNQIGLSYTARIVKNGPVSIAEVFQKQCLIYPNPSSGWIQIPEKTLELKVFDFSGKQIMSLSHPGSHVDFSNLKNGLYIIELIGESNKRVVLDIQK